MHLSRDNNVNYDDNWHCGVIAFDLYFIVKNMATRRGANELLTDGINGSAVRSENIHGIYLADFTFNFTITDFYSRCFIY